MSEFGLTHLSAGDLLRAEVARGSRQGERIQEMMKEGELVPPVSSNLLEADAEIACDYHMTRR